MKRISWIDAIKGIAMCMVIYSHIDFAPREVMMYIGPIFLSIFFTVSGYTMNNNKSVSQFIRTRSKNILVPWAIFGSINILLTYIYTVHEQESIGMQFLHMVLQIRGKNDELWFLPCMFVISTCYFILYKYIKSQVLLGGVCITAGILSCIYTMQGGAALPWHIQMIGIGCFYFYMGTMLRKHIDKNKQEIGFRQKNDNDLGTSIVLLMLYITCILLNYYLKGTSYISFYVFGHSVIFYFLTSIIAMMFCIIAGSHMRECRWLQYIGENSLLYFSIHGKVKAILVVICNKIFSIVFQTSSLWMEALKTLICLSLTVAGTGIIVRILKHGLRITFSRLKKQYN